MSRRSSFNLDKKIGKVLFIVEGLKDEINILHKIFVNVFDYQYECKNRDGKYSQYNKKDNPSSSVFVINTKESNIGFIYDYYKIEGYLDNLFVELINEYDFPVDNAAIFFLFDRDAKSNTKGSIFEDLIEKLSNSRESNEDFDKSGLLLLSYPSIESFTTSNFSENCFEIEFGLGNEVKQYLHPKHWTNQKINIKTLENAVKEMLRSMEVMGTVPYNLDDFKECNRAIFDYQEAHYAQTNTYRLLSLLCIALIDLGLIEIEE